ncbi:copper resistance protein CopC [Saccharopolyspora sp. NPDC049357]|uniref:copper resistance CopC family protein n=1 Tax=Saccharopolyspora sp. NPDC049357 TaxID=3154507 RepID=UPI003449DD15
MWNAGRIALTVGRTSVALALAGAFAVSAAGPAVADATLLSTDPAEGTQLAELPAAARLQFNQPVHAEVITVTVTGPNGENVAAAPAAVADTTVTQPLARSTVPGAYTVAFRVVSEDGHPVAGKSTFTLLPAPGAPPAPQQQAQPPQAAPEPTTNYAVVLGLIGVAVLLAIGVGAVIIRRFRD